VVDAGDGAVRGELMWAVATEPGVEIKVLVCQGWRRQGTPVSFLAIEVARGGPATGGKVTGQCGGAASTGWPTGGGWGRRGGAPEDEVTGGGRGGRQEEVTRRRMSSGVVQPSPLKKYQPEIMKEEGS
jgi:hypothetical protein